MAGLKDMEKRIAEDRAGAYDYFDPVGESIRRQDDFLDDGEKKVYSEPQISYCKRHYGQYGGIYEDV